MSIHKLKKYFCLFIGLSLLISNTQICCQEITNIPNIISQEEIEELSAAARDITRRYNRTLRNIVGTSGFIDYVNSGQSQSVSRLNNPYNLELQINNTYKVYYREINEFEDYLKLFQNKMRETYARYLNALPEGTYLKKATENYINGRMNTLFRTQNHYLDNLLSISDIIAEHPEIEDISKYLQSFSFNSENARYNYLQNRYQKDSNLRNSFIRDLADNQTHYQKAFSEDIDKLIRQLKNAENSFSRETVEFFSQRTHTSEEIINYFAKRLPEEQKAVLFALKVSDNGVTIRHLIPYVRYYLKQTNRRLWKLDRYSAETLPIVFSRLSLNERVNYIDDLLDFTPETRLLRDEIQQVERNTGRRIINRNTIKLSGTFMTIGAFLIATTITDTIVNNSFNEGSIGAVKLAEIKRKMDNGELISFQEMAAYYTDERNTSKTLENPSGLFEVFEGAITMNDCLDQLNIETMPIYPVIQQEQINDAIGQHLNNFNPENINITNSIM